MDESCLPVCLIDLCADSKQHVSRGQPHTRPTDRPQYRRGGGFLLLTQSHTHTYILPASPSQALSPSSIVRLNIRTTIILTGSFYYHFLVLAVEPLLQTTTDVSSGPAIQQSKMSTSGQFAGHVPNLGTRLILSHQGLVVDWWFVSAAGPWGHIHGARWVSLWGQRSVTMRGWLSST